MHLLSILIIISFAGILNGSYAAPLKKLHHIYTEDFIWLCFSCLATLILPLLVFVLVIAHPIELVKHLSSFTFMVLVICGLTFGVGQVCYSVAYKFIGIGLNCIIHIAIGTSSVALLSLFLHPNLLTTPYGQAQLVGTSLFLAAIFVSGLSGYRRLNNETEKETLNKLSGCIWKKGRKHLWIGIALSIFAGIGVGAEGVGFTLVNPRVFHEGASYLSSELASAYFSWSFLYLFAWPAYFIYFLAKKKKNKINKLAQIKRLSTSLSHQCNILIMALCYFMPVIIFSYASYLIGGKRAPTIAWPLFMSFVVLVSNSWGFIQGEWQYSTTSTKVTFISSIL